MKFLIETVFLALAVYKEAKRIGEFHVGINCKDELKNWIPDPIKYFDFNQTKIDLPGIYKITQFNHLRTNHAELARSLGIPYPLDVKNPFVNDSEIKKSVVIACNGMKEVSLPERHEKYICDYFSSRGYMTNVLHVPDYYYKENWSNNIAIQPLSLNETNNILQSSEIIIATDNCYLTLANTFLDKKVVGIFGPTVPRSLMAYNAMKILQVVDENPIKDYRVKKSCPCEGPKFCHRDYKIGDYPYCFSSISPDQLIKKIEKII